MEMGRSAGDRHHSPRLMWFFFFTELGHLFLRTILFWLVFYFLSFLVLTYCARVWYYIRVERVYKNHWANLEHGLNNTSRRRRGIFNTNPTAFQECSTETNYLIRLEGVGHSYQFLLLRESRRAAASTNKIVLIKQRLATAAGYDLETLFCRNSRASERKDRTIPARRV